MLISSFRKILLFITPLITATFSQLSLAEVFSEHLSVISSADPGSNAIQSFVIIEKGKLITQGIKHSSKQSNISQQTPFVIKFTKKLEKNQSLQ